MRAIGRLLSGSFRRIFGVISEAMTGDRAAIFRGTSATWDMRASCRSASARAT